MQDKLNINSFVKLFTTILLIIIIVLSKSTLLFAILTLLSIILIVISNINVKKYAWGLKKILLWLIFIILAYIIILKTTNIVLFIYKMLLIIIILEYYAMTTSFDEKDSGINCFVKPFKLIGIDVDKVSFNILIALYSIAYFIESKNGIKSILPKELISRLILAGNKANDLKTSLKLKFYKVKRVKWTFKDIKILIIFILFFIAVLCKEVIV